MNEDLQNAFLGSLVADAVSMPVHWYYDTRSLDRDYPNLRGYEAPRSSHPDSILWRSKYEPLNEEADILHAQAAFWGKPGVHYHQFLQRGENTLNFLLAAQLYRSTVRHGGYDKDRWLQIYVTSMRDPDWHRDTYVEEYHRAFFEIRARGKRLEKCGIDDLHIGGLAPVPALIAALDALGEVDSKHACKLVSEHVDLTHKNLRVRECSVALTHMLLAISQGVPLRESIAVFGKPWVSEKSLERWADSTDRAVVGQQYSPACYLPDSFKASLYLAWKYADDFSEGILANARVGGDNCHRGAVIGSLLAAANEIDKPWLKGLKIMERLRCDTLEATF